MGYGKRSLGRRPRWGRGSRNRVARWLLALALAGGATALVIGQGRDAAETMAGLGPHQAVAVARRDLDPGHAIEAGDVTVRQLPVGAVAPGAVRDDIVGRTVTAAIVAGEVVNQARLAPAGVSGLAALIPAGQRGVAVPRPADGSGLAVQVGDVVDVLSPGDAGSGEDSTAAAEGATVIGVSEGAVTLAVRADEAAALAAAVGRGVPVLALVAPNAR